MILTLQNKFLNLPPEETKMAEFPFSGDFPEIRHTSCGHVTLHILTTRITTKMEDFLLRGFPRIRHHYMRSRGVSQCHH